MNMKLTAPIPKTLSLAASLCLAILAAAAPARAQENAAAPPPADDAAFGKTIVIVFSQTGKTRSIAEIIAAKTGADIYAIETASPYPSTEGEIITLENTRRAAGTPPELKGTPPDLEPYSFVFLGTPVWFGALPEHVSLFLDGIDFGGRNVALFATAGSKPGNILMDLAGAVKGGNLVSPGIVNRREDEWGKAALEQMVDEYLAMLKNNLARSEAAKRQQ
jgi:flavodoxin